MTVTADRELANHARDAGSNMSATLTVTLDTELKKYTAMRWHEENAEAIAALSQSVDETEYSSDGYWNFQ